MEKQKKDGFKSEKLLDFLKRKADEAAEEFELPSGLLCKMTYFSAKKAALCQKIAVRGNGDSAKVDEDLLYGSMIAECCQFRVDESSDWEGMIGEDVSAKLPGMDFMVLQGKLSGVSLEEEK